MARRLFAACVSSAVQRFASLAAAFQRFDAEGIEIPYPHLTVYAGADRTGKAPAFPMQQVHQH